MAKMQSNWICPNCHKEVDYNFEDCWNCNYNRDGATPKGLSTSEQQRETRARARQAPNRICLRCKTDLTYAGSQNFHEGTRWGTLGDFAELFVNQTKLEMYFCPSCRHEEFFV